MKKLKLSKCEITTRNSIEKLMLKHNITEADLKKEYADRYYSKYLKECTREELIDLMINEQVYVNND